MLSIPSIFARLPVVKAFTVAAAAQDNDSPSGALVASAPVVPGARIVLSPVLWSLDLTDRSIGFSVQFYSGTGGNPSTLTPVSARLAIPQPSTGMRSSQMPPIIGLANMPVYALFRLDAAVPTGLTAHCGIEAVIQELILPS